MAPRCEARECYRLEAGRACRWSKADILGQVEYQFSHWTMARNYHRQPENDRITSLSGYQVCLGVDNHYQLLYRPCKGWSILDTENKLDKYTVGHHPSTLGV